MLLAVNSAASPVRRHTTRRFAWVFRTAVIVALLHVVAVGAPGAALAHDVNTAAGHEAEDAVVHSSTTEARLNRETLLLSSWASAETASALAADPGQVGQWGPVSNWPVVGIHAALLPNGKVLALIKNFGCT